MATYTASSAQTTAVPRQLAKGTWTCVFGYNNAATLSATDVILMGKIPHGATIVDGYVIQEAADTGLISVGIDSTTNLLASISSSAGEMIRLNKGLPYTVSVSDDAVVRFQTVRLATGADFTTSARFKVVLLCTSDP